MVRESLKSGPREIKILKYFQLFFHTKFVLKLKKITMQYSRLDETTSFKSFSHDKEGFHFKI
jgi:hypothetical protein